MSIISCTCWSFVCLLWENVYAVPLPFKIQIPFFFFLLSCMSLLHILDINPLSDIQFENILSHYIGCFFIFLIVSCAVKKPFSLMASVVLKEQSKTSKYVILGTSRMDSKDLYIFYYIPIRLFLNKCVFHSFQRDDMEFNECMPFTSLSDH